MARKNANRESTLRRLMKKFITIVGFWKDNSEAIFTKDCIIGTWDGLTDEDHIFYWFEVNEEIIGDHNRDFVVLDYYPKGTFS